MCHLTSLWHKNCWGLLLGMFLWTWLAAANFRHEGGQLSWISFWKRCSVNLVHQGWERELLRFYLCGPLVGRTLRWDDCLYVISRAWAELRQRGYDLVGAPLHGQQNKPPRLAKTSDTGWVILTQSVRWRRSCQSTSLSLQKLCLRDSRGGFFLGLSGRLKHHYVRWSLRNRAPLPVQPSIKPLDCYDLRWHSHSKGLNWKKRTSNSVGNCWASWSHSLKVNSIRFQAENGRKRESRFGFILCQLMEKISLCMLNVSRCHAECTQGIRPQMKVLTSAGRRRKAVGWRVNAGTAPAAVLAAPSEN